MEIKNGAKAEVIQSEAGQKVSIPQYVADWIEECKKNGYTLFFALSNYPGTLPDTNGQNNFAKAWLNGYKVQEPLYYVHFVKDDYEGFLNIDISDGKLFVSDNSEGSEYQTKFTESEIKALDSRYWQFAVEVEE
ncbi:DUF1642 domain-containing protein [Aerococcaceae bacterium zg-B36]|uniref:DUF1642 domain-containing protein n=1 Tax=Aerococcaceae bacterium zg-252 TaxID=2796928 RepID=UPI001BD87329|nr:DUF1642 domain-containing protein [Aerococcaceae bacterium zg-B36]